MALLGGVVLLVGLLGLVLGRATANTSMDMEAHEASTPALVDTLRQPTHEHADFAVFVRGERLAFDDGRFLSTEDRETSPNVHLHEPRVNVAHIHREQTTWDEFLLSLGMELTDDCLKLASGEQFCEAGSSEQLHFFVNGVEIDSLRFQNVSDLDRVLISFGEHDAEAIANQVDAVTDEACIPSESCSSRIDPNNPEREPCRRSAGACHG